MSDDMYDIPGNSMKAREEAERKAKEAERSRERGGITPRKSGIGGFFRQLVQKGDVDSVTNIFANAMINAVGDTIDEVTGNLTHRAKTVLYGTEDYNRGRGYRAGDRYGSYSKYYEERNGRPRPTGSTGVQNRNDASGDRNDSGNRKWKYNEVFFDNRIFGGARGARLAAWRVIKKMDEQITDPDHDNVSVADFIRYCKQEDPQNERLTVDWTEERLGWTDEELIARLEPIEVIGGYIIELPKPKSLYN